MLPTGRYAALDEFTGEYVFTHRNRRVVEGWIERGGDEVPPVPAAPRAPNVLLNDTIAHIANTWGPYEMPRFGLTERVRHIPTGKTCVVMGYRAWSPPIILYSLDEVGGESLPELTPLSDMAHMGSQANPQGNAK